jgi:uncharacterized peroxidase-related enzyme
MPHINLPDSVPGIRSLVMFRPDTGKPLYELAQVLLRDTPPGGTLQPAERELIAAFVSHENACEFCGNSHAAAARFLFGPDKNVVDAVLADYTTAPISAKLRALLPIANATRHDARTVTDELVSAARAAGATDADIHDAVLTAATFAMFNRYVDGLATIVPDDPTAYEAMGERMGTIGYVPPTKK